MVSRLGRIAGALRPRFFRAGAELRPYSSLGSYPRAWLLAVTVLCAASVLPVVVISVLDYRVTRRAVGREHQLQVARLASNARRTVTHYLEERLEALSFAAHGIGPGDLSDPEAIGEVLRNLRQDFGGLLDLGVIDERGVQVGYRGPFDLEGRDYSGQAWFRECRERGAFVSSVFLGYRDVPHVVIAVEAAPEGRPAYLLRATLDLARLRESLASYAPDEGDDIFLMSRAGIIQTPSRRHGDLLALCAIPVPPPSGRTEVLELEEPDGTAVSLGYAYITTRLTDTPFVLMLIRGRSDVARFLGWFLTSRFVMFGGTVLGIVLVVGFALTWLFNHLYDTDLTKARTLGQIEDVNRLVALGRLAAGVAHEINNPLAVIKESAGYIEDLIEYGEGPLSEAEVRLQTEGIIESVTRCGAITRQLLSFSRRPDLEAGPVDLPAVIRNVLAFQRKEAEYRSIELRFDFAEDAREIVSDRGKLQEVLLNLVMNAFDAMEEGGVLTVSTRRADGDRVSIRVEDTGCGMTEEVRKSVFEPFFTTKPEGRGTGLGLSITFGLVSRLGGEISLTSEVGAGTTFEVLLPAGLAEGGAS